MLNQRLLESVSKPQVDLEDTGDIRVLDLVDAGPKAGTVVVEIEELIDSRTAYTYTAPEDLVAWVESLTEDEIDGLADPYGYNLAEAEDW